MDWSDEFMKPEIYEGDYFEVEEMHGESDIIPADVLSSAFVARLEHDFVYEDDADTEDRDESIATDLLDRLAEYTEQAPVAATLKHGFLARLSAPGYMDCTEWTAHATEDEAIAYLDEMFGDES